MAEIVPSELNPRKSFDQEELEELAQSIKENGLVQPITLRKTGKKDIKYEIVCGERRFRACQLIGEKTIQAIVKELDDKQAFACMIIENLQRKAIDPMEEASALSKLHSEGTMKVAEMAKMLGKSQSFVVGRIQLSGTIPEFVQLMRDGVLVLTHLLDICKLPAEQQKTLYDNCFTEESRARWTYKFPNIPQLHDMIAEHVMNSLDGAGFSTSDTTLAEAEACDTCPLNTKNSPDRFKDVSKPRCLKRECFMAKKRESIFRKAKELSATHQIIYSGKLSDSVEIVKSGAEKFGLSVAPLGAREYVRKPVEPDREVYADEETYQKRLASYQKQIAVFEDNIKDGTVIPVFEICYSGILSGEEKFVFCAPYEDEKPDDIYKKESLKRRITELKTRLKESVSRKSEELTEKRRAFMAQAEYSKLNTDLSELEKQVFYAILVKRLPFSFKESIGCVDGLAENFRKAKPVLKGNMNSIVREFIRTTLSEKSVNYSTDLANMLEGIMDERFSPDDDKIKSDIESSHKNAESKIKDDIDALKSELKKPASAETSDGE